MTLNRIAINSTLIDDQDKLTYVSPSIPLYPNCPSVTRTVTVGGLSKTALRQTLQHNAILLNEAAEQLFVSTEFVTATASYALLTVELTVQDLGFPEGATIAAISERASTLGLGLCPLEVGPHLRLQYLDQPEGYWGQPVLEQRAPSGSITIATAPLVADDDFPKGFYLRRMQGVLWLRGYRSGPDHVWSAGDHFVFRQM